VCCRKKRKAKEDKRDADEQGLVDGEEDMDAIDDDAAKVTISNNCRPMLPICRNFGRLAQKSKKG
jgi:hypothetical protein